jgi:rSAM/selenodomain-associated transferase 1
VIPALDEADSIAGVVEGLRRQETLAGGEIVVVDNGSTDGTGDAARKAGARVVREERRGYGRACLSGVLAADAEIVVLLDADAADDPDDLPRVLEPILSGEADLVVGSRKLGGIEPGSMTWQQRFGNGLAAFLMRRIYGMRVTDMGPFRAIRRDRLLALEMAEMTYGWPVEMMVKSSRAGYRYREVPVRYRRRGAGVSKVGGTIRDSLRVGYRIILTTLRHARWTPGEPKARSRGSEREAFYVIAKAPRPGFAKTRLGESIGHEEAVALYGAFLRDLAARFSGSAYEPGWYVTPPDALPEMRPLIGSPRTVLFQGEGDLTERQAELFRLAAERGEERVVLAGADSPTLDAGIVSEAFRRLGDHDLVLGATQDGGYYLIGMRDLGSMLSRGVLDGVRMSTGSELESLVEQARGSGLSVGWVDTLFDVDVTEDLRLLRDVADRPDLANTRAALESLGLTRESGAAIGEDARDQSG